MDKYRLFWQIACALMCTAGFAQEPVAPRDSLPPGPGDSTIVAMVDLRPVQLSKDALDDQVEYGAKDSMWFDVKNKQLHLYGQAYLKYTTIDLKAGYILLDYEKNEVSAEQFPDETGQLAGLPEFKDGEQEFTATKLRYNFRSKKGIIYEARTKQQDLYVLGQKAKFIGEASADSSMQTQNTVYNKDALITTCDAPVPHYGIHTKKLKVVPNKLVVTGFSNVEIGGIPTPLVLPFGFYPITQTRKSGLIIPRDFEFADREGLGIKDWGYYFPISDHLDVTMLFNAYTSGTWGVQANVRYNQRYRFRDDLNLRFNNRVSEDNMARRLSAQSFGIRWSHQQDPKAHPTRRFGGSLNIETNRDQNRNRNDYASVYQNTLTSNLNYSQTFPGKPYQFNASLSHSQNTQTRLMNISFPTAAFNLQRVYPFKRKKPVGKERWYEKLSLTYSSKLQNTVQVADTLLFTSETLRKARMGIQHNASTDFNFKVFKYINISPRVNYEENWYPYSIERQFIDEIQFVYDTVADIIVVDSNKTVWGRDTTIRDWGFKPFRQFDAGITLNTALFFTKQFRRGWFRGIRHTMKPSLSTGFRPDYSDSDYYFRQVQTSAQPGRETYRDYGIFDDAVYGRPSNAPRDMAISYSLSNILEMKFYSARKDTVKRVRIFDNLTFSGSYSLTMDTLKWSQISTGGLFRLFKGLSNLTWNARFDPYIRNEAGVRVNKFAAKEEGKLLRLVRFEVALNTQMSIGDLRKLFEKDGTSTTQGTQKPRTVSAKDDFLGLFEQFRINHRISFIRQEIPSSNRDTLLVGTNNISLSGRIPLTPKWSIDVGNISYDFQAKRIVYPDLGLSRNLHCWQFSLRWQPLRGTYEFFINVTPGSSLDFLKLPYRKNNFDGQGVF